MSRLVIKSTAPVVANPTVSTVIGRLLDIQQLTIESRSDTENTALVNDMRTVISMLGDSHPYLRYCNSKNFTDGELLERQTEVIGALGAGLKTAFGAIKGTISRVANSGRFLPGWMKWTGLGVTWGSVVGSLTFMSAIEAGADKLDRATNFDAKGLSDRDGLTEKRAAIPQNQKFTLKDKGWQEKNPITTLDIADQMDEMVKFMNILNKMTNSLSAVIANKMPVDTWLNSLNMKGSGSVGSWIVPPLHKNVGFAIYKNGDKYFLEKVTGSKPLSTTAIIPQVKDMMWIQKAAKNMDKSAKTLNSNMEKTLKRISTSNKEVSKEAAFAYKALLTMFEDTVPLAKDMLRNGKHFIDDSVAAIMSYRIDGE